MLDLRNPLLLNLSELSAVSLPNYNYFTLGIQYLLLKGECVAQDRGGFEGTISKLRECSTLI